MSVLLGPVVYYSISIVLLAQILDVTERMMAADMAMPEDLNVSELDKERRKRRILAPQFFLDHAWYEPDAGCGALLVDARNTFNKINRYLMPWNYHHCWYRCRRFVFNRYHHLNIFYLWGRHVDESFVMS